MIKRKYVVLLMLMLVSVPLAGLLYSNLAQAQAQSTVTGYVSVPAAAFMPTDNVYNYSNYDGVALQSMDTDGGYFCAQVHFPNGATVTNVTSHWFENDIGIVKLWQRFNNLSINCWYSMTDEISSSDGGVGSSYDDTINFATIDNSQCAYYLLVQFTRGYPEVYYLKAVFIEYTLPSQAVGGFWIPVDKFSLLAPYIALVATIILAVSISVAYIKYRKK